jgi:hypothetical protein
VNVDKSRSRDTSPKPPRLSTDPSPTKPRINVTAIRLTAKSPTTLPNTTSPSHVVRHVVSPGCGAAANRRRGCRRHGPHTSRTLTCRRNTHRIQRKELFPFSTTRRRMGTQCRRGQEDRDAGLEPGGSWCSLVVYVLPNALLSIPRPPRRPKLTRSVYSNTNPKILLLRLHSLHGLPHHKHITHPPPHPLRRRIKSLPPPHTPILPIPPYRTPASRLTARRTHHLGNRTSSISPPSSAP